MSLGELLTKRRAVSGAAVVAGILFSLGSATGCRSTVSDEDLRRGIAHPAEGAATIAEARAINIRDEITRLEREQSALETKRADCLKLVSYYLEKSSKVWSDPSVSERDRPALAGQFTTLANENQVQADRYEQMAEACGSRISVLAAERDDQLRRAQGYKEMTVPAPNAE